MNESQLAVLSHMYPHHLLFYLLTTNFHLLNLIILPIGPHDQAVTLKYIFQVKNLPLKALRYGEIFLPSIGAASLLFWQPEKVPT